MLINTTAPQPGAQPTGNQPSGFQPTGAQPTGTQPTGAQPQAAQPSQLSSSDLLLLSNAKLYTKISGGLAQANGQQYQEIVTLLNDKKILDKLEKGLLYYKVSSSDDVNDLHKLDQQLAALQGLQFAKKEPLSDNMKEMVVKPLTLECSLLPEVAFTLLDGFFISNHNKYYHFEHVNRRIREFMGQVQPTLMQVGGMQGASAMALRQKQLDEFQEELGKIAADIVACAKRYYIQERKYILLCHVALIGHLTRQNSQQGQALSSAIRDKLLRKNLGARLAQSLIRSQTSMSREFTRFQDPPMGVALGRGATRESLALAVQEEQIELLKLLFTLFYAEGARMSDDKDVCSILVEYLLRSTHLEDNHLLAHQMAHNTAYTAHLSMIEGLTQLTCLVMLQLHQEAKKPIVTKNSHSDIYNRLLNPDNLSQPLGPLVLAIVQTNLEGQVGQQDNDLGKMAKVLCEQREKLATMVSEVLESQVFASEDLQAMHNVFYSVIYGWLNVAHRFYSQHRLEDERSQIKSLALEVLANPEIVRMVWLQTENKKDCTLRDLEQSLQIFRECFEDPARNSDLLLKLLLVLSGSRSEPRGPRVADILHQTQVEGQDCDSNLLEELIAFLASQIVRFENQLLEHEEFKMVESVLIFFAKVLKQDPLQYVHLNNVTMNVAEKYQDGKLGLIFAPARRQGHGADMHFWLEGGNHPFLCLLMKALHSLTPVSFEYARRAVCNLVDALSALYDCDQMPLRHDIIAQLEAYEDFEVGGARIVAFFSTTVLEAESSLMNFKATESFLRLLTKIYKRKYPLEVLPAQDGLAALERSILMTSLEQVYVKCLKEYFNINFVDAASIASFSRRLLKLSRTLLDKFSEVPQAQKAPLCEPMPTFDPLLELLSSLLNSGNLEQICVKVLELTKVEERLPDGTLTSHFENKIVDEALQVKQAGAPQIRKLIQMSKEAIQLLTKMTELALIEEKRTSQGGASQADQYISKRLTYVRGLRCVQALKAQLLEPNMNLVSAYTSNSHSRAGHHHTIQISLQSQIARYALSGTKLDSGVLRARALDNLTLTCRLWQVNLAESIRPCLYQLVQALGPASKVEALFFDQLQRSCEGGVQHSYGKLSQCLAFFDLLIVAAQSQTRFVEMLLKEDSTKRRSLDKLCNTLISLVASTDNSLAQNGPNRPTHNLLYSQMRLHAKFKLTALLAELAQRRLCSDLVTWENSKLLGIVMLHVVEKECLQPLNSEQFKIAFNGQYLTPCNEFQEDYSAQVIAQSVAIQKATNFAQSKVTLCLFLKLLVSEFSRNPEQRTIRSLIASLATNDHYRALCISKGQVNADVHQLMSYMRNLNDILQANDPNTNDTERHIEAQRRNHDQILGRGLARTEEQAGSALYSRDGSVFLKGSLCIDLVKVMEKKSLASFLVSPGADLMTFAQQPGHLGPDFYVSTDELQYAMRTEMYQNSYFVTQATTLCTEYNLALTTMLADHLVLEAKQEFEVGVGKIALRDSQTREKVNQLVPMSFLPLVDKDCPLAPSPETFKRLAPQLTKTMIKQANALLKQIQERKRCLNLHEEATQMSSPQNALLMQLDQDLLKSLVFTMGIISSEVSAIERPLAIEIRTDLDKLVQQEILLKMPKLVDIEAFQLDSSMLAQELTVYEGVGGVGSGARASGALELNQRRNFEHFVQLVTQCFQLCIRLKESNPDQSQQQQRAYILSKQQLDDAYVKILAWVLSGMRNNLHSQTNSSAKGSLQVFVLAVQLIDQESQTGLNSLMKKQGDQPLKIFLGRLMEPDCTEEEMTMVLQLLINYAASYDGAAHLSKVKVLDTLFKANIMQSLNDQDLYMSRSLTNQQGQPSVQQVRNPRHIHWCQLLLLVRTLNDELLEGGELAGASAHEASYFSDLVRHLHHFKQRVPKVLHIGLSLDAARHSSAAGDGVSGPRAILSMALLEEIELLTAVMQQVFEHADHWAQADFNTYSELKDYTLFAISKLLEHCDTSAIIPASLTEQHLAKVTQSVLANDQTNLLASSSLLSSQGSASQDQQRSDQMSAFQLKGELHLLKVFLSQTCSLLNCVLLSKKLADQGKVSRAGDQTDLLQTWTRQSDYSGAGSRGHQTSVRQTSSGLKQSGNGVFSEQWLAKAQHQGPTSILAIAFDTIRSCQVQMMKRYSLLKTLQESGKLDKLYEYSQGLFHSDEWVQKEYCGGFNSHQLADDSVEDVLEMSEIALQVSGQVAALLLEKVRDIHGSSELRYNATYGGEYDAQQRLSDEQQVIYMASDLMRYLRETQSEVQTCAAVQQPNATSAEGEGYLMRDGSLSEKPRLDAAYLEKLQNFVKVVKEQPGDYGGMNGSASGYRSATGGGFSTTRYHQGSRGYGSLHPY